MVEDAEGVESNPQIHSLADLNHKRSKEMRNYLLRYAYRLILTRPISPLTASPRENLPVHIACAVLVTSTSITLRMRYAYS